MSSPPLSKPGYRAGPFKRPVHSSVGSRWPQALSQVCKQLRVRGFVLATWPSCRGPRQPAVTELAVVPPTTPCSPSLNAWPARPRCAPSRHILAPTRFRAFHSVPSYANPRADLRRPHLIKSVSAAFLIETGADFLIGITGSVLRFPLDTS